MMVFSKKDFPLLKQKVNGSSLIYFDNAATTQKPSAVITTIADFYKKNNNNIHRSIYALGEKTTQLYENARKSVAGFINADPQEIIFTKGCTEGINFIATAWAHKNVLAGDEILVSELEHHSNLIPWQQCVARTGAQLKFIPITADGILDLAVLPSLITKKTKLIAVAHVSNALGTHNDIGTIIKIAKRTNTLVLIDAAQSIPHQRIDVKQLGCDFLAFSGHKMLGPTGIGVLYIKKELQAQIDPYQYGGGMVYEADYTQAQFQNSPHRFEAGTPPIASALGLARAIDYLSDISFDQLRIHEASLCQQLIEGLSKNKKIRIVGPVEQLKAQGHLVGFTVHDIHAHDIAAALSAEGICVRAGNHCAQPLAKKLGINAWVRASFYGYNSAVQVKKFLKTLEKII